MRDAGNCDNVFGPRGRVERISPVRQQSFPDEWYSLASENHFWFEWRFAAIRAQLSAVGVDVSQPARAFEIGCGSGTLTRQFERDTAWTVDGTDLNLGALCRHQGGRGRVLYYDITERRQDFLEEYDYLLLFDVLEHIEDTEPFLRAAFLHLRPSGMAFIGAPALQSLFSPYDIAAGHVRRYNKSSLRGELEGFEVEVVDTRYWGMGLTPLLLLRKVMLAVYNRESDVIRRGFRPPGQWFNRLMSGLMKVEHRLVDSPPFGSSVMLAARKRAR